MILYSIYFQQLVNEITFHLIFIYLYICVCGGGGWTVSIFMQLLIFMHSVYERAKTFQIRI